MMKHFANRRKQLARYRVLLYGNEAQGVSIGAEVKIGVAIACSNDVLIRMKC